MPQNVRYGVVLRLWVSRQLGYISEPTVRGFFALRWP